MKNPIKIVTGVAVLAAMLIAPLSQVAHAERGPWMPIQVNIEGKLLKMPTNPVIESGTTLVPMRAIFEALGAEIKWNNETQTVTGTKDATKVELTIGSKTVKKNGTVSQLAVAPKLVDGNTMIPLRYVSESLDMHVAWIGSERQVYIAKDRAIEGTTMSSVEALFAKYTPMYDGERFAEQPSFNAPYKAGRLTDGYLQNGLKAINLARELAGIPTFSLDSNLNELAQHGSVLLISSDQFNHTPAKPADMDDAFYQKASLGAKGNIAGAQELDTPSELSLGIRQLLIDQDNANLGHRRHLLNPSLTTIGLGYSAEVKPYNTAIKSGNVITTFDYAKKTSFDYDYVTWPSKGYFPVSWLAQGTAFSVSFNPAKYQPLDSTKVSGTITNAVDGSVQKLTYGQTGGFYINVEKGYGEGNCISFYPYNDDKFFDQPNPGDEFTIELNGIYKTDGTPATVKYTVKLFAME